MDTLLIEFNFYTLSLCNKKKLLNHVNDNYRQSGLIIWKIRQI